jgi:hypothetical protein
LKGSTKGKKGPKTSECYNVKGSSEEDSAEEKIDQEQTHYTCGVCALNEERNDTSDC